MPDVAARRWTAVIGTLVSVVGWAAQLVVWPVAAALSWRLEGDPEGLAEVLARPLPDRQDAT